MFKPAGRAAVISLVIAACAATPAGAAAPFVDDFEPRLAAEWHAAGAPRVADRTGVARSHGLTIPARRAADFIALPTGASPKLSVAFSYRRLGRGSQVLVRLRSTRLSVLDDGRGRLFAVSGGRRTRLSAPTVARRRWTRLVLSLDADAGRVAVKVDGRSAGRVSRGAREEHVDLGDVDGRKGGPYVFDDVEVRGVERRSTDASEAPTPNGLAVDVVEPAPKAPAPVPAPPAAPEDGEAQRWPLLPDAPAPGAVGDRVFAPSSVWNAALPANAPLHASSGGLVAELKRQVDRDLSRGAPWINTTQYSTPVYRVGAHQATVKVKIDSPWRLLDADFAAVPIPAGAKAAAGSDGHMVVHQPATDSMWELFKATQKADGWHASWGGKIARLSSHPGVFPGTLGATATGLPLLGGLIRQDEAARGRIDHALALAVPDVAAGKLLGPAVRTDGRAAGGLPAGARFRLDPKVDVAALKLPPMGRMIAEAAQRYGVIVRDTSGVVTFYAEAPRAGQANPWPGLFGNQYPAQLLAGFPWERLQALR